MKIAKLFITGKSQAVRLPKEFCFDGNEVYVKKVGNAVILYPKEKIWETFMGGLNDFSDDFYENGRDQGIQPPRESL